MKRSFRKGFTLIELLIVVIIIGILATIALPRLMGMKDRSYETVQNADLKNLITAQEMSFADFSRYAAGTATNINGVVTPIGNLDFTPSPNISAFADTATYQNGRVGFGGKTVHGQRSGTGNTGRCVIVTAAAGGNQFDCSGDITAAPAAPTP